MALAIVDGQGGASPQMGRIVQPDNINRWTAKTFGACTPEQLFSVLGQAEKGQIRDWADLAEYMVETDPHLRAQQSTAINAVASLPFEIEPGRASRASDEAPAAAAAEFIARVMAQTQDVERTFSDLLYGCSIGWAVDELIYSRDSGAWISKPEWVHPRRFVFDPEWRLNLYDYGQLGAYGTPLARDKFIVHLPRETSQYPTRAGILRACAWAWLFGRWAEKYYIGGAERMASPPTVGKLPRNAPDAVRDAMKDGLENLSSDQVIVIENEAEIIWPQSAFTGAADVWKGLIEHCERRITKCWHGSTLNSDGDKSGSRALGESQADNTIDPRTEQRAKQLAGTIERDWFGPLCRFNTHLWGGVPAPVPRLVFKFSQDAPQSQIFAYHMSGKLVTRDEVRSQLRLEPLGPERGGDELLDVAAQQAAAEAAPPGGAAPAAPFPQKALSRKATKLSAQKRLPFSTSLTSTPSRIRMPGSGQ